MLMLPSYVLYAIIGGTFASLGSLLGKLSGSYESWIYTVILFIAMIVSNSYGCVLFAKSLNHSSSTLQPTLISTASNYVATALFGVLFYNETTSLLWWSGTTLILAGIILISHESKEKIA